MAKHYNTQKDSASLSAFSFYVHNVIFLLIIVFYRLPSPPLAKRALKKMPIFGKTNENVVSFYTCEQFSDIQIPSLF